MTTVLLMLLGFHIAGAAVMCSIEYLMNGEISLRHAFRIFFLWEIAIVVIWIENLRG